MLLFSLKIFTDGLKSSNRINFFRLEHFFIQTCATKHNTSLRFHLYRGRHFLSQQRSSLTGINTKKILGKKCKKISLALKKIFLDVESFNVYMKKKLCGTITLTHWFLLIIQIQRPCIKVFEADVHCIV